MKPEQQAKQPPHTNTRLRVVRTLGFSLLSLILLLTILVFPFQKSNLLSAIFDSVGLSNYATASDLIANGNFGAAIGILNIDVTKPETCGQLWPILAKTPLEKILTNNATTKAAFAYSTKSGTAAQGSLEVRASEKASTLTGTLNGKFQLDVGNILTSLDKTFTELERVENEKQGTNTTKSQEFTTLKNEVLSSGFSTVDTKASTVFEIKDSTTRVHFKELLLQIGSDLVTQTSNTTTTLDSTSELPVFNNNTLSFGKYSKSTVDTIISQKTADNLLTTMCSFFSSSEFGNYNEKIEGTETAARSFALTSKNFAGMLDVIDTRFPALLAAALQDEKLLTFLYEVVRVNTPTYTKGYNDFVEELRSIIKPEEARLSKDKDLYEAVKRSLNLEIKLTSYVNRSLAPVGTQGSLNISFTREGVRELVKSSGSFIVTESEVDALCEMLCHGIALGALSIEQTNSQTTIPQQTQTNDEFLSEIENNPSWKKVQEKYSPTVNKILDYWLNNSIVQL